MRMLKILFLLAFQSYFGLGVIAGDMATWNGYPAEELAVKISITGAKIEEIVLKPILIKPDKPPPWSSVVVVSGSGGKNDGMWPHYVKELTSNGIAVLLVDSFSPRGFPDVVYDQFRVGLALRLHDPHQLLDYMRTDDRFLSNKIAIGGQSNGAVIGYLSAYQETSKFLKRDKLGFNAFFGSGADCHLAFNKTKLWGPLLLIHGTNDDYNLPEVCRKQIADLQSKGEDANFIPIEGVTHHYSTDGGIYLKSAMRAPYDLPIVTVHSFSDKWQVLVRYEGEEVLSLQDLSKKYSGFLGSKLFGAHVGGNMAMAPEVARLVRVFLQKNGW